MGTFRQVQKSVNVRIVDKYYREGRTNFLDKSDEICEFAATNIHKESRPVGAGVKRKNGHSPIN